MSTSNSHDQGHGDTIHVSEIAVGIICALEFELGAMTLMLDHRFKYLQGKPDSDKNSYTPGTIGHLNVVIAGLPTGRYGQNPAAAVATHMARTFVPNMKVALMVGIGGGIPSPDHDIRLGDIVVGVPTDTCSGVIQIDLGKRLAGGKFKRTGSLDKPPASLLTALTTLRSAHGMSDVRFPSYVRNALQRLDGDASCWDKPATDRLLDTGSQHPQDKIDCDTCVKHEVKRLPRDDHNPRVHYGIIATGNLVVKDAAVREELREQYDAICIEMEAAGISESIPCMVIRGICDYADSHKNKEWQQFAALAAAAYSKELLQLLRSTELVRDTRRGSHTSESARALRGIEEQSRTALMQAWFQEQAQRRAQAIARFKTTPYEEFKDVVHNRAPGTCGWVLKHPTFLQWKQSTQNTLLWISADPGCGKSVLTRALVDEQLLSNDSDTLVCHFFFRESDGQNHVHESLCALLHQTLQGLPDEADEVLSTLTAHGDAATRETTKLLEAILRLVNSSRRNIIFVVDALDECHYGDCDRLVEALSRLVSVSHGSKRSRGQWCKVLATGRPYDNIETCFAQNDNHHKIRLKGEEENEAIENEINMVIRARIRAIELEMCLTDNELDVVLQSLLAMHHRTYLWLQLVITDIETQLRLSRSIDKLELIPKSVDEAYAKLLSRIPVEERSRVATIFSVMLAAERPFSVWEMHAAIEILENRIEHVRDLDITQGRLAAFQANIRRWCKLFVFVQDEKLHFFHQTVRSFLL
ncbi:nucleoside phosphorylase domain-containing protein, partial [Elsinoe ampelina]